MRHRRFHAANGVAEMPGGNEDHALWIQRLPVQDEVLGQRMAVRSVYELTDEEREAIAAGANITLYVIGAQPPVMLEVTDEPLGKGPYTAWLSSTGWPMCPGCGKDELYSLDDPATVQSIVGCYRCNWKP